MFCMENMTRFTVFRNIFITVLCPVGPESPDLLYQKILVTQVGNHMNPQGSSIMTGRILHACRDIGTVQVLIESTGKYDLECKALCYALLAKISSTNINKVKSSIAPVTLLGFTSV